MFVNFTLPFSDLHNFYFKVLEEGRTRSNPRDGEKVKPTVEC